MQQYTGKKWRVMSSEVVKDYSDVYNDTYIVKNHFVMTRGYKQYLKQKTIERITLDISVARNKLERQLKEFGHVDDVDYSEFLYLVKRLEQLQ